MNKYIYIIYDDKGHKCGTATSLADAKRYKNNKDYEILKCKIV